MTTQPTPAEPCQASTDVLVLDYVGAPCPYCGHSTLAHPGQANPVLELCAICASEAQALVQSQLIAQLRQDVEELRALVTPQDFLSEATPADPQTANLAAAAAFDAEAQL